MGGPQWWSITVRRVWVSSYCCSSSTRSSKMTSLLLGLVSSLPFFRVSPSLPLQKTVATLTVLEILCIWSPLESSMFSNICLYVLPGVHHISLFLFFIAFPHLSFHWTVKSMTMIFFILVDQNTISGPKLVGTMSGNFSFCYKSTANCQSCLWSKVPEVLLSCLSIALWPSLTKGIRTGFFSGLRILPLFFHHICQLSENLVVFPCKSSLG